MGNTRPWMGKDRFLRASKGNLKILGVGCIARNDYGIILAIGAQRLRDETNNEVESQATLLAIKLGN